MRTVTLRVGEWVKIGEFGVSVLDILDGAIRWEVVAPADTEVRTVRSALPVEADPE